MLFLKEIISQKKSLFEIQIYGDTNGQPEMAASVGSR